MKHIVLCKTNTDDPTVSKQNLPNISTQKCLILLAPQIQSVLEWILNFI